MANEETGYPVRFYFLFLTTGLTRKRVENWRYLQYHKTSINFCSLLSGMEAEKEILVQDHSKAKFIAVMTDGSTDSSACEEELVYARCCHQGDIKVKSVQN